jgi:hypothetical protein
MRPDGTNKRALRCTGPSLTSGSHRLAYSPNGRYLAGGTSLRTSNGYGYRWAVTVVNLKTRQSHIVYRYNSENGVVSLTWSPDSSQLVANVEYGGGYGMFRISVATRRLIKSYKTANFASASWKPGTRMLLCTKWFASEPGAPWRTQLRRLDGTLIKTIGEGQADPVYSPAASMRSLSTAMTARMCGQSVQIAMGPTSHRSTPALRTKDSARLHGGDLRLRVRRRAPTPSPASGASGSWSRAMAPRRYRRAKSCRTTMAAYRRAAASQAGGSRPSGSRAAESRRERHEPGCLQQAEPIPLRRRAVPRRSSLRPPPASPAARSWRRLQSFCNPNARSAIAFVGTRWERGI